MTTIRENQYPSKEECRALLESYGTPEHVINHCYMVSKVAEVLAIELNRCGLNLDVSLLIAAGCLHDIARVHSKHDKVGAEYLTSIGLEKVAKTTWDHTFHKIEHNVDQINEEDLLCIADRVVLEDKYVGPEKRMEYITSKAILKFGPEKRDELNIAAQNFIGYVHELENFIGKKISQLI